MKFINFLIAAIITITGFSACKKEEIKSKQEKKLPSSLEGYWNGTYYNYDRQTTTFEFRFQLNENGNLDKLTSANEKEAEGKWSIDGTQFNATYEELPFKMTVYSLTGYYDAISGKITGTYINSAAPGIICNFIISKQ